MTKKNSEQNWGNFNREYRTQYGIDASGQPIPGFKPLPEDHTLANEFVLMVYNNPELMQRLGQATLVRDDCMGGIFRASLLVAPFADASNPKTRIELCDLEGPQLQMARENLANGLGGWQSHIDDLAESDKRGHWQNAIPTVEQRGVVVPRSIFDSEEKQSDVGSMAFGAESLTGDIEECHLAVNSMVGSVKPNGLVVIQYMVESNGWGEFPAVPITQQDMVDMLEPQVDIVGHAFAPASGGARKKDDPTHYTGMALVVGIVKDAAGQ